MQEPGVSTASVALANGMNVNLLRRWDAEWDDGGRRREEQSEPAALTHKPEFVRLASEVRDMAAAHEKIELVLERGEASIPSRPEETLKPEIVVEAPSKKSEQLRSTSIPSGFRFINPDNGEKR